MKKTVHAPPTLSYRQYHLPAVDRERKKVLTGFQKTLAIKFKNLGLLNLAFMHRSVSNETGSKANNERLEFLGDSILGAITATLLYEQLADRTEGELAKIKSVVVSEDILSGIARELQIDGLLLLSKGEYLSGGRNKKTILADAMEALIGAFYLDSGYKAAYAFVSRIILPEITTVLHNRHYRDYKSLLQEFSHRLDRTHPTYNLVKRSGPEHDHFFWVEVRVHDQTFGPGTGRNKKSAEQAAAKIAYEHLSSVYFKKEERP
ncbi:MAG: ribonuclease III [Spirochaetaceae bacterium]|jgi:ribonuclease-3|nr:ribonuclease III [Spirochaetaceae bacterium]